MAYTVKRVAEVAGVSVRTLHHYDEIGLLKPASVSPSGYRLYSEEDLERLQQILFFRELGFSLPEIRAILDRPGFDRRQALLTHRQLLVEKRRRIERLIQSVDRTLAALEGGVPMDAKEMFDGFDEATLERYREEARAKYDPALVDESYRRASRYTRADWAAIMAESQEINEAIAGLMDRDPADPEVQRWVERWHRLVSDRFYPCSLEIFRGLGDLYVEDSRFTAHYEQVRPGLAQFMRAAMHAYCDRLEGKR